MTALDVCTANDEMANEAFDVYVRLFYKIDDNEQLRKKIIEMLSPISTMANAVRIKLSTKTERFFEIAEGQDRVTNVSLFTLSLKVNMLEKNHFKNLGTELPFPFMTHGMNINRFFSFFSILIVLYNGLVHHFHENEFTIPAVLLV